ncbi:hypothetical protein D3C86_1361150 [compost metagenome]
MDLGALREVQGLGGRIQALIGRRVGLHADDAVGIRQGIRGQRERRQVVGRAGAGQVAIDADIDLVLGGKGVAQLENELGGDVPGLAVDLVIRGLRRGRRPHPELRIEVGGLHRCRGMEPHAEEVVDPDRAAIGVADIRDRDHAIPLRRPALHLDVVKHCHDPCLRTFVSAAPRAPASAQVRRQAGIGEWIGNARRMHQMDQARRERPDKGKSGTQRWPKCASRNSFSSPRGWERQYCFGASTLAPSLAAACHGQRGS